MGLVNIQNTNFENGVTNRNAADLFGSMGQLDPTKFNTFMDDFNTPEPNALTLVGYEDIATGAITTFPAEGGFIQLQSGAVAGNAAITAVKALGNTILASKPVYFRGQIQIGDWTNAIVILGLADGILGLTPDDGIFFQSVDASPNVDLVVRSGTAQIAIASALFVGTDDDIDSYEFYWDGIDRVYYGVNGNPLGFIDLAGLTLPSDEVGTTVGVVAGVGAGGAVDCGVDYLFCAQER